MRLRPFLAPTIAAVAITAVVAAPSIAQTSGVQHWLGKAGVVAAPASFTELKLVEQSHLFTTVEPSGDVRFSFVATNVAPESAAKAYQWTVSVGPDGKEKQAAHGGFDLAGGASTTVDVRAKITDCSVRNQVTVTLTGPDVREPALHYWVLPHSSEQWKSDGGPSCAA